MKNVIVKRFHHNIALTSMHTHLEMALLGLIRFCTALLLFHQIFQVSVTVSSEATAEYGGDHYDGAVALPTKTAYVPNIWNYDYSHVNVGGTCKKRDATTGTLSDVGAASATNKYGPNCWAVASTDSKNMCGGKAQTPINLDGGTATVDITLTPPEFLVTNEGCEEWVQVNKYRK